ncbi:MAG TPA: GNAT family N-acetyltransferase, partial [Anaerolineae bacterium]
SWPSDDFTLADNWQDLAWHQREHKARVAFTYTVLDPSETTCLGCVYIKENNVAELASSDHEAIVRFWVRQSHLAGGLDRRLLEALVTWFKEAWAFAHVYFHANDQDERQIQLLNASPLLYRVTATIPNRNGRYRFYG